jgi:hypothetical protein
MLGGSEMRIWHKHLLPYLPDLQFKGQLRELVLIMHDWRDRGKTNHLLINKVMEYPKDHLASYWNDYQYWYKVKYGKELNKYNKEFAEFGSCFKCDRTELFEGWHDMEYLRVCMANLYEKYKYGVGKSKITDKEWERLLFGYNMITNEHYEI